MAGGPPGRVKEGRGRASRVVSAPCVTPPTPAHAPAPGGRRDRNACIPQRARRTQSPAASPRAAACRAAAAARARVVRPRPSHPDRCVCGDACWRRRGNIGGRPPAGAAAGAAAGARLCRARPLARRRVLAGRPGYHRADRNSGKRRGGRWAGRPPRRPADPRLLLPFPPLQTTAIPAILAGGDVLLASATGSGKTLAFLAPLFESLRTAEAAAGRRLARPRRPRALVLGPTRELTDQTHAVAKALARHAPLAVAGASAGGAMRLQAAALERGADLLVATPTRVLTLAREGLLALGDVEMVVLVREQRREGGRGSGVAAARQPTGPPLPAGRGRHHV